MERKNGGLEDDCSFQLGGFSGSLLVFGGCTSPTTRSPNYLYAHHSRGSHKALVAKLLELSQRQLGLGFKQTHSTWRLHVGV